MPFIDLQPQVKEQDKPVSASPPQQPIAESPTSVQKPTSGNAQVPQFKALLAQIKLYSGDATSQDIDQRLILGLQRLEDLIETSLKQITNKSVPSLRGMIWQTDHINPRTSPQDIIRALTLINQAAQRVKSAQATVDTFDTEEYQTQQPLAVKPNPNREDFGIETGDPDDTQQIGEMQVKVPENMPKDNADIGMDDRVLELNRLMEKLKA